MEYTQQCLFQWLILSNQILNMEQPKILVAIRKRPLSKKQTGRGENDIVTVKGGDTVIVSEYKQKVDLTKFLEETIFNFDFAFNEETHNEEIYDLAVRPLVDSAFQGAKVTCFAYGQTGSGKTYTMNGNMGQGLPGLYTLGANDIFDYLASPQFRHLKAKLSFYQIYCGKLFDLLNKRTQLKLRQDNKNNINIIGLQEANVSSSQEFIEYLALGSQQRVTSQNSANADSSRSHAILQISLKDGKKLHGKISFIDLAGNQRGADHMDMDKQTRIDGAEINKSLLSLKECIRALDQGKGHTPFRGSKLTMVLKDSFVGFCRTIMIGNVSPSSASSENTLNTLRYADRVKQLRKPQDAVSREEQKAKELMLPRQNKNAIRIMINNQDDAEDIARKRDEAQKEYGIMEEPKKPIREENPRKNSFAMNNKPVQGKPDNKSSSVSKNFIGNQPQKQPSLQQPPTLQPAKQQPTRQTQQQPLNRYNSSGQNLLGRGKQQPMQIQSSGPYYVPGKGQQQGQMGNKLFNQGRQYQQNNSLANYSIASNNSQNFSMNYSQIPQQPMSNRNNEPQYNFQSRQPNNNYSNNYQQNPNLSYCQNPYNQGFQQQGQFPQQNQFNQPSNQFNQPQFNQYPSQQNNFFQNRGPSNIQIPQRWQEMVNAASTSEDPSYSQAVLMQMNSKLLVEQDELIQGHSQTLRKQIDIIKSQMALLNNMQIDKSKIQSRGYLQFMQESIQDKISLLEMLREKLINFTYKLDQMQEIESAKTGRPPHLDDEQLLDDIN